MTSETEGGQPLIQLLQKNVTSSQKSVKDTKTHYTTVTLVGLSQAPKEFKDLELIRDYLVETSPIAYDPSWTIKAELEQKARTAGIPIEHVPLYLGTSEERAKPIYKAYKKVLPIKGGSASLQEIRYYSGTDNNWWAWVGLPDKPALIADDKISGLRVRVKNIQIDRARIFDELFGEKSASFERFNKYYVGEVHIQSEVLIPNARRDGFEDNLPWTQTKSEFIDEICAPLAKRAYDLSKDRQKDLNKIEKDVKDLEKKSDAPKGISSEKKVELLHKADQIRKRIAKALTEAEPETRAQLTTFVSSVEAVRGKLSIEPTVDFRSKVRAEVLKEVVALVQATVEPYLDPKVFLRVRRALSELR